MQRKAPSPARPRGRSATLLLCLAAGGLSATVCGAVALTAGPAAAAAPGPAASAGPRVPSDPAGQLTTSMMPPGSPDAKPATTTGTAAPRATQGYLDGIDVASYQHPNGAPITWSQVRSSGQSFAIVKATEGTTYTNGYVTGDAAGARAAGLQIGLYHFGQPGLAADGSPVGDAQAQADYFSGQIEAVGGLQLPPTLDLEITNNLDQAQLVSWTGAFLQRVQADTGRLPMIYTGPYFWMDNLNSTAFTTYPLWEADYTTGTPMSFGGWSHWTLWQWTDGQYFSPPPISGIAATYTDRDRFAGSVAQLTAFASSSTGNVAPFTGTASRADYPDGMLVQPQGQPEVYEMIGLAPVYLPAFADANGSTYVHELTAGQFYSLRSSPLDGTWLRSHETGQVYRMAGGAPLYVTSFAPYGPVPPITTIGQADFDRSGTAGVWSHLRARPMDGTFLAGADSGQVYRVVGGAPVYVSSWSYFGAVQPYTTINQATIDRAREGSVFAHLAYTPGNGALIADPTAGTYWVIANGVLTATSNTGQAFVVEGHTSIVNRGMPGVWSHLV